MKNITLKVDDLTYQKARVRAAKAGTSVSALVRDFLNREDDEERARENKRIEALKVLYAQADKGSTDEDRGAVEPFNREEIYATRIR